MSVVHQLGQWLFSAINQVAAPPSPFLAGQTGRGKVIAVAAQKGGVGKTTSAVHLAAGLAERHRLRTLLIDLDAQGHVASSLRAHLQIGRAPV